MNSSFSHQMLKSFVPIIHDTTGELVEDLSAKCGSGPFDVMELIGYRAVDLHMSKYFEYLCV